jgi:hypothetical protein
LGKVEDKRKEIEPAQKARQENIIFLSKIIPRLGRTIKNEFSAVIHLTRQQQSTEQQAPLPDDAHNDDVILRQLKDTNFEQLSIYVDVQVQKMENANTNFIAKRSKGVRKLGARFQELVVTFNRFLKAYSGIVEVMQNADSQFGNVAFSTPSLLFAV